MNSIFQFARQTPSFLLTLGLASNASLRANIRPDVAHAAPSASNASKAVELDVAPPTSTASLQGYGDVLSRLGSLSQSLSQSLATSDVASINDVLLGVTLGKFTKQTTTSATTTTGASSTGIATTAATDATILEGLQYKHLYFTNSTDTQVVDGKTITTTQASIAYDPVDPTATGAAAPTGAPGTRTTLATAQTVAITEGAATTESVSFNLNAEAQLRNISIQGTTGDLNITTGADEAVNVSAGGGNDVIQVSNKSEAHGGDGHDSITGYTVYGDAGDDDLTATGTADGGTGNDNIHLIAGRPDVTFAFASGGDGNDTIIADRRAAIDGGAGDDQIEVHADGNDARPSAISGGAGNDLIIADTAAVIDGGSGDDIVETAAGSTLTFSGGDGNDEIHIKPAPDGVAAETNFDFGDRLASAATISTSGGATIVHFADSGDTITIHPQAGVGPLKLSFKDTSVAA